MKSLISIVLVTAGWVAGAFAQAPASKPAADQSPTFKSAAEEVSLDVVVRDKKGRLIKDLKPDDFQVFDNGEKREIKSFRLVEGAESVSSSGARTQLDPLRQVRLVTLLFSGLDDNGRKLSRQAAETLLKGDLGQNVYMSVMTIDHKLEILQAFTNDRDLLRKAVARATSGATEFAGDNQRVREQLEQLVGPNQGGVQGLEAQAGQMSSTGNGASGAAGAPQGSSAANAAMAQILLQIVHANQEDANIDWGRTNVFALLNVVKEHYRLPGRKSILFFSSGFAVPQEIETPFDSVISTANRANVSFYVVDARGLTTYSPTSAASDALNNAAGASAANTSHSGVSTYAAGSVDRAIDAGKADTQNTLERLAKSTGGELIANSNDFSAPMRKFNEDVQSYYEITYDPHITNYNGAFRKVQVKAESNDLRIQSRSGYFALPPSMTSGGQVVAAYEVPLLKALDEQPVPRNFPFQSAGMHFRGESTEPTADIVVDIPLSSMTLQEDKTAKIYEGKMSYVALVKDAQGQVVKKLKSEIPLKITADKIEAYKAGHFVYSEAMDMPPGRYTLEAAVLDGQGEKISARKSSFVVPVTASNLGISSVAVIRNMKPKEATTKPNDPMVMADKVITPVLNPTVKKSDGQGVSFYFVVYADKSVKEKPALRLEFSRDGQVLGAAESPLGDPDAQGRIQYVTTAPIAGFEPGNYQVRFVAKQGTETAAESVSFVLEP